MTPEASRRRITRSWIVAGAGGVVLFVFALQGGESPFLALLGAYAAWATYWGWLALSRSGWSSKSVKGKLGKLFVGYLYGFLGGGIYQFLMHRRRASADRGPATATPSATTSAAGVDEITQMEEHLRSDEVVKRIVAVEAATEAITRDGNRDLRLSAILIDALTPRPGESSQTGLEPPGEGATENEDPAAVRYMAAQSIGRLAWAGHYFVPAAVPALIVALFDVNLFVRQEAAEALGEMRDERAINPLRRASEDDADDVRAAALGALDRLDRLDVLQPENDLQQGEDSDGDVRSL